jgi:endonuclease/exonuclease/phosphatase family metal-dependent hydrolase
VGAWNTLEAVTWNLKSLPVSTGTVTHIAELLERMAVDLVAVEKVADVSAFEKLVAALPHHDGVVSPDAGANGTYLKTGFIYRTDQLHLLDTTSLFTDEPEAFPRPPFRAWFEEILADCSTRSFVATVLHLAPGTGAAGARRQAMGLLKDNLDDLVAASPQIRLLVLGDFNDRLDAPASDNIFTDFLADTTHYTILTQPLSAQDNVYSFLLTKQLIDHVMVTASWLDSYADPGGTTEVLPLDRLITEYDYERQVSNHLPVVATFAR